MEGTHFITSLAALSLLLLSPIAQAKPNQCSWSCGKISDTTKSAKLKSQFEQVQSFFAGKTSCALVESFDHSVRNPRLGALQALAISTQNCSVPADLNVKTDTFLYQVMNLQGLKLSPEQKQFKAKDFEPSQIFKNAENLSCLNPVSDGETVHSGDLIISKGDALVIDTVGVDPFGIDEKVRKNVKVLDQQSREGGVMEVTEILQKAKKLCDDWVNDSAQFKISVIHAHGRSSIFPTFGKTSSPWETAISERANAACISRVSEEIAKRGGVPFPLRDTNPVPPQPGVLVLRHNSDAAACRVNRDQMPTKSPGLECVQCCDFSAKEGT